MLKESYEVIYLLKFISYLIKYHIFLFLDAQHNVWDLSSPSRDWIHFPCCGSMEFEPLYRQGSPYQIQYLIKHTSFFLELVFLTGLLRLNLQIIQPTDLKGTIQWF